MLGLKDNWRYYSIFLRPGPALIAVVSHRQEVRKRDLALPGHLSIYKLSALLQARHEPREVCSLQYEHAPEVRSIALANLSKPHLDDFEAVAAHLPKHHEPGEEIHSFAAS